MLPHVEYVTTKESISRMAAKYKAKSLVRRETIEGVKKVLEKDISKIPVYCIQGPWKLILHIGRWQMLRQECRV